MRLRPCVQTSSQILIILTVAVIQWCKGCGFTRTLPSVTSTVVITSPNYPSSYSNSLSCTWTVNAPSGQNTHPKMNLAATAFNTEQNYDKVFIGSRAYHGSLTGSQLPNITVWGMSISMRFTSDGSVSRQGFRFVVSAVAFVTQCGGLVSVPSNASEAYFQYPPVPMPSAAITSCTWAVALPQSQSMTLTIVSFTMRLGYGNCGGSQLKLRLGSSSYDQNLCDRSVNWNTHSNFARVQLTPSMAQGTRGFRIKIQPCGFTRAISSTTTITSPNYPSNYPDDANCMWTVTLAESAGYRYINIRLTYMYTRGSADKLYIGSDDTAYGYVTNRNYYPLGTSVNLRFTTDSYTNARGFTLNVIPTNTAPPCGDHKIILETTTGGTISHPPPTNSNPSPETCLFKIESPTGRSFDMNLEVFSMKTSYYSCGGPYLYLTTRSAGGSNSQINLCSSSRYRVGYKTHTTEALVKLQRNRRSLSGRGFRFRFTVCGSTTMLQTASSTVTVRSPRYPSRYPSAANCSWDISAPESSTTHRWLKITSTAFRLHNSDQLLIDDYPGITGSTFGQARYSIGSTVNIRFRSDSSYQDNGFSLTVSAVPITVVCGSTETLSSPSGSKIIMSPRFPYNYSSNANCLWTVSAPSSSTTHRWLRVALNVLNTDEGYDLLRIDNYLPVSGTNAMPQSWISRSSPVRIRFTSNSTGGAQGFIVTVTASNVPPSVCGGSITIPLDETGGIAEWPLTPPASTSLAECIWNVTTSDNRIIEVTMETFGLKNDSDNYVCQGATLNVESQRLLTSSVITDRLCTNTTISNSTANSTDIASSAPSYSPGWGVIGQRVAVIFSSTVTNLGSRFFRFRYKACGITKVFTNSDDVLVISSPRFPHNYPTNVDCIWNMSAIAPMHRLVLAVYNVSLNATEDYLQIESESSIINATSSFSTEYTISKLIIKFHSDNANTSSGFNLTVYARPYGCPDINCSHLCSMVSGTPTCACPNTHGWIMAGDRRTCQDINECAPGRPTVCHGHVDCVNTPGSFICNCTDGYKLNPDNRTCVHRDGGWTPWSEWSPCSYPCAGGIRNASRTCTNPTVVNEGLHCLMNDNTTRGQYESRSEECNMHTCPVCSDFHCSYRCIMDGRMPRCVCPNWSAWRLSYDNQTCMDVDECSRTNPPGCIGPSTCFNTLGSFICTCLEGYTKGSDGRSCVDRNGSWTEWAEWSTCSAACEHYTSRNCTNPTAEGTGLLCKKLDNERGMNETKYETCSHGECEGTEATFGIRLTGFIIGGAAVVGFIAVGVALFKTMGTKVNPTDLEETQAISGNEKQDPPQQEQQQRRPPRSQPRRPPPQHHMGPPQHHMGPPPQMGQPPPYNYVAQIGDQTLRATFQLS